MWVVLVSHSKGLSERGSYPQFIHDDMEAKYAVAEHAREYTKALSMRPPSIHHDARMESFHSLDHSQHIYN